MVLSLVFAELFVGRYGIDAAEFSLDDDGTFLQRSGNVHFDRELDTRSGIKVLVERLFTSTKPYFVKFFSLAKSGELGYIRGEVKGKLHSSLQSQTFSLLEEVLESPSWS